jgi:hypothetical protein
LETFVQMHEAAIRLGFFLGIFAIMALWEVAAPRRALSVSKAVRWVNNLGLVGWVERSETHRRAGEGGLNGYDRIGVDPRERGEADRDAETGTMLGTPPSLSCAGKSEPAGGSRIRPTLWVTGRCTRGAGRSLGRYPLSEVFSSCLSASSISSVAISTLPWVCASSSRSAWRRRRRSLW